ncbi:hypothetical protein EVAR_5573_1 [Eumeta japonica]|uniref:Uncharacterized protein n=1 Tax=Eumeta variegata TaxID=151549 RepID=A0A4C1U1A9_EUMVA|nr:hypothetical protein EVAR_5573_1 [Eumeta japonica]
MARIEFSDTTAIYLTTPTEYRRKVAATTVYFHPVNESSGDPLSTPPLLSLLLALSPPYNHCFHIGYPISTQEAGNALVTPSAVRLSHIYLSSKIPAEPGHISNIAMFPPVCQSEW